MTDSRFHPADPDGILLDNIQFQAWAGLIHWLLGKDEAHSAFAKESGRERIHDDQDLGMAPEAEQDFIDHYTGAFTRWATKEFWGDDEITPSIQAAIDRLPQPQ